jgi:hypothetical protein
MSRKVVPLKQSPNTKRRSGDRRSEAVGKPAEVPALGPGLHAGRLESVSNGRFLVRLATGTRIHAAVDEDVDPALAEECLREGRRVIVTDGERGPVIIGALQTAPSIARREDGNLSLEARDVRIRASRALVLEAGPVTLRVDKSGVLRLDGERMVVDMGAVVRFVTPLVELP